MLRLDSVSVSFPCPSSSGLTNKRFDYASRFNNLTNTKVKFPPWLQVMMWRGRCHEIDFRGVNISALNWWGIQLNKERPEFLPPFGIILKMYVRPITQGVSCPGKRKIPTLVNGDFGKSFWSCHSLLISQGSLNPLNGSCQI